MHNRSESTSSNFLPAHQPHPKPTSGERRKTSNTRVGSGPSFTQPLTPPTSPVLQTSSKLHRRVASVLDPTGEGDRRESYKASFDSHFDPDDSHPSHHATARRSASHHLPFESLELQPTSSFSAARHQHISSRSSISFDFKSSPAFSLVSIPNASSLLPKLEARHALSTEEEDHDEEEAIRLWLRSEAARKRRAVVLLWLAFLFLAIAFLCAWRLYVSLGKVSLDERRRNSGGRAGWWDVFTTDKAEPTIGAGRSRPARPRLGVVGEVIHEHGGHGVDRLGEIVPMDSSHVDNDLSDPDADRPARFPFFASASESSVS